MSIAPRRVCVNFLGGAGHGLKTSMYGKKVFLCCYFFCEGTNSWCFGAWSDLKELEDS